MDTQFLLERREFKYYLPRRLVPVLREMVKGACVLDSHAGPDGRYTIRSLYFDTSDFRLFYANEREEADRFKMRVRSYPGTNAPVFLEVKRRTLDIIRKTRQPVPMKQWVGLLAPTASPIHFRHERFLTLLHTYQLRPVVLVQYEREAYVSTLEHYARVSIDTHIGCQGMTSYALEPMGTGWRYIDHRDQTLTREPVVVVELKFANAAPRWMLNIVKRLHLIRHSYSKYCYSMRALYPPTRMRCAPRAWG